MSLIEKLGGYEKAKEALIAEQRSKNIDPVIYINGDEVLIDAIDDALLDYRRQHNIFEVGDKVVHPKFSNMKIYEICEISGDLFTVFYDRKSHSFKTDVRHATDEEIKAGKRLEVDYEN